MNKHLWLEFHKWTLKNPESSLKTNLTRALLSLSAAFSLREGLTIASEIMNGLSEEDKAELMWNIRDSYWQGLCPEDKSFLDGLGEARRTCAELKSDVVHNGLNEVMALNRLRRVLPNQNLNLAIKLWSE